MSRALKRSERRTNDAYFTPEPLAEHLVGLLPIDYGELILEPHAGGGAFVRALRKHSEVIAWDIDPTLDWAVQDFLAHDPRPGEPPPDWIVGNPPFDQAEEHVRKARAVTERHVAFLLRLAFLESAARFPFWQANPARHVWVLAQRPSFDRRTAHRDRRQGALFSAPRPTTQVSAGGTDSAAYGFFWWDAHHTGPTTMEVISWEK